MTTVTVVFTVLGLLRLTVYVAVLALPSAAVSLSDAVPVMLTTGVSLPKLGLLGLTGVLPSVVPLS